MTNPEHSEQLIEDAEVEAEADNQASGATSRQVRNAGSTTQAEGDR